MTQQLKFFIGAIQKCLLHHEKTALDYLSLRYPIENGLGMTDVDPV